MADKADKILQQALEKRVSPEKLWPWIKKNTKWSDRWSKIDVPPPTEYNQLVPCDSEVCHYKNRRRTPPCMYVWDLGDFGVMYCDMCFDDCDEIEDELFNRSELAEEYTAMFLKK